jgi:site-specific recombinase XerD
MQKYGRVAAIPKSKRRFHALRHAIAVHLLDAGVDVAFVQDRLGHTNMGFFAQSDEKVYFSLSRS